MKHTRMHRRRAGGLVVALVTLLVVMLMAGSIVRSLVTDLRETRQALTELQAHYLADAAVARAVAMLKANREYTGETWRPEISSAEETDIGLAEIRIQRATEENQSIQIIIDARYPDHTVKRVAVHLVGQVSDLPRLSENNP